jgi:hypothetical protein
LGTKGLVLRQLRNPSLLGKDHYSHVDSINLFTPKQELFKALERKHYEILLDEVIGKQFPLLREIVKSMKKLSEEDREVIADKLPRSLELLARLREDMNNPPSANKK